MILALLIACGPKTPPKVYTAPIPRNEIEAVQTRDLEASECTEWAPVLEGATTTCKGMLGPLGGADGHVALVADRERARAAERFLESSYVGWEQDRAICEDRFGQCWLDERDVVVENQGLRAAVPVAFTGGVAVGAAIVYGLARALLAAQ